MTTSLDKPAPRVFASSIAESLTKEWDRLRYSTLHLQRVRNWGISGLGATTDLDEVLTILGRLGDRADDQADARLSAVVVIAATDEFATSVVLHRILPALVAIARRRGGGVVSRQKLAFEELLAHAWITIRTYPIDRRPARVAAGLVRDIEYRAFVRDHRLRSATERSVDQQMMDPALAGLRGGRLGAEHPMDLVLGVLDEARVRGVDEDDLRFAFAWAAGADNRSLAETFGICDRTVRNRRAAVASRLRQAVAASAA